jgi:hypothetical protein
MIDTNDDYVVQDEDNEELVTTESPTSSTDKSNKKKLKKGVFNREWLKITEYELFLKEYKNDATKATCIACNQQFSIHYRGKTDIDHHIRTQKHQNNFKSFNINRQLITTTMKPTKEKDEVSAAEAVLVYHGVKHGHSYLSQQCLVNVCKTIFSSSTIANQLSCGRTKSTFIALNVLAPCFTDNLINELKNAFYYSLMYDASNKGNVKMFPFCVQFLSVIGVRKGIVLRNLI